MGLIEKISADLVSAMDWNADNLEAKSSGQLTGNTFSWEEKEHDIPLENEKFGPSKFVRSKIVIWRAASQMVYQRP